MVIASEAIERLNANDAENGGDSEKDGSVATNHQRALTPELSRPAKRVRLE
jgi:hypothetical protein